MTTCTRCHGTKQLRRERDLGMGVTETIVEPCLDCLGELRDCHSGHQIITYRGTACPLCAALAAARGSTSVFANFHEVIYP